MKDLLARFATDPAAAAEAVAGAVLRNVWAELHFYLLLALVLSIGLWVGRHRTGGIGLVLKSKSFRVDAVYAAVELLHIGQFLVIVPLGLAIGAFLTANLPWLRIDNLAALPIWVQATLLFIVTDFWTYWYHRLQHASPVLWQFHKTHHSQENLTALTTFRKTVIDRMADVVLLSLPPVIMNVSVAMPMAIIIVLQIHQLLIHANTGWTFGPIGKVIVSPAFHELHHSRALEHRNTNFGPVFSFWDQMFGSRTDGHTSPLQFGLSDERIPESFLRQFFVPLTGLWALAFKQKGAA